MRATTAAAAAAAAAVAAAETETAAVGLVDRASAPLLHLWNPARTWGAPDQGLPMALRPFITTGTQTALAGFLPTGERDHLALEASTGPGMRRARSEE